MELPATQQRALIVRLLAAQEDEPASAKNRDLAQPDRRRPPLATRRPPATSIAPQRTKAITAEPPANPIGKNEDPLAPLPSAIPSADELIMNAKRDVGKIDRELRKAHPQLPQALHDSVPSRLAKGIASAAKRSWLSAATTEEILSPSGAGRRMYRINTPAGDYCVTYESDSAAAGVDTMQHGVQQIISTCPD